MMRKIHPYAGGLALLLVLSFWLSTVVSEASGDHALVATVKTVILYAMALLIPAMAMVGASGMVMGTRSSDPAVARKRQRMPLIAANGLLVLVPSAVFLQARAVAGDFSNDFILVQGLELMAGAMNILLLYLNMKDGLEIAARRRQVRRPA